MTRDPATRIPARSPLAPPEFQGGIFTLTQPHDPAPVGWLWVSQNGALEDWVTTSNWREPAPGNSPQAVTFAYVAPSTTVATVTAFLVWIRDNYPGQCPGITDRYRHTVSHFAASCPP